MTDSPEHLADPPVIEDGALGLGLNGDRQDLLSDLLGSVRLRGDRIVEYAPAPSFSIGFADIGTVQIIEHGDLILTVDGDERAEHLRRGDVILVPRGDPHHVTSTQHKARPGANGRDDGRPSGTAGPRWLCGTFRIGDPRASHLLASLPPVIVLRGVRDQALEWFDVCRRMLLFEMHSPSQGSVVMVGRILDLLFIQILRAWAASPDVEPNWLAGALDPGIGPALAAIHSQPGRAWTVEDLAGTCNLSRSTFADRFTTRVGKPPAGYLGHVRLDAAATLLRETSIPVAAIARTVGYTSESAFSRAFRQRYDAPPARWRGNARAS
jgi:AraC-like DNA-binding protein